MDKLIIYGREFSRQTMAALAYLNEKNRDYEFYDIDFDEEALYFVKHHKIAGLPVIKKGSRFLVGWNESIKNKINEL